MTARDEAWQKASEALLYSDDRYDDVPAAVVDAVWPIIYAVARREALDDAVAALAEGGFDSDLEIMVLRGLREQA